MLVGEHGRVIPVRRFKEIAYTVTGIAIPPLFLLLARCWTETRRIGKYENLH